MRFLRWFVVVQLQWMWHSHWLNLWSLPECWDVAQYFQFNALCTLNPLKDVSIEEIDESVFIVFYINLCTYHFWCYLWVVLQGFILSVSVWVYACVCTPKPEESSRFLGPELQVFAWQDLRSVQRTLISVVSSGAASFHRFKLSESMPFSFVSWNFVLVVVWF